MSRNAGQRSLTGHRAPNVRSRLAPCPRSTVEGSFAVARRQLWSFSPLRVRENSSFPEAGPDVRDDIRIGLLRIVYNGRSDFMIGIDVEALQFDSKTFDQMVNFGSVGINLWYYF